LKVKENDVIAIVRHIDSTGEGRVYFDDFERAFAHLDERFQSAIPCGKARFDTSSGLQINPHEMKELFVEEKNDTSRTIVTDISEEVLKSIRIQLRPIEKWTCLWTSNGTKSRKDLSIWAPDFSGFRFKKSRFDIFLGHYAAEGFGTPSKNKPPSGLSGWTIDVVDERNALFRQFNLTSAHLNFLLPHPIVYKRVWSETSGHKPLYIWKATPPSESYLTLGMICTNTDEPPPLSAIRCIPRKWLKLTVERPSLIWNDAGTGGLKGSVWKTNSLNLLIATEGHEAPSGYFFDLAQTKFYAHENFTGKIASTEHYKSETRGSLKGDVPNPSNAALSRSSDSPSPKIAETRDSDSRIPQTVQTKETETSDFQALKAPETNVDSPERIEKPEVPSDTPVKESLKKKGDYETPPDTSRKEPLKKEKVAPSSSKKSIFRDDDPFATPPILRSETKEEAPKKKDSGPKKPSLGNLDPFAATASPDPFSEFAPSPPKASTKSSLKKPTKFGDTFDLDDLNGSPFDKAAVSAKTKPPVSTGTSAIATPPAQRTNVILTGKKVEDPQVGEEDDPLGILSAFKHK